MASALELVPHIGVTSACQTVGVGRTYDAQYQKDPTRALRSTGSAALPARWCREISAPACRRSS